jgi:hypothetical protein
MRFTFSFLGLVFIISSNISKLKIPIISTESSWKNHNKHQAYHFNFPFLLCFLSISDIAFLQFHGFSIFFISLKRILIFENFKHSIQTFDERKTGTEEMKNNLKIP